MLEKQIVTGLVTILEDRSLQVREDTVVSEDGIEISRTYNRYTLAPDQPVDDKPQFIQELAAFLWTPEVRAARDEKMRLLKERLDREANSVPGPTVQ